MTRRNVARCKTAMSASATRAGCWPTARAPASRVTTPSGQSHTRFTQLIHTDSVNLAINVKLKVKERIVLSVIHLRTTGRHLSMGSHSVICHPTEVTADRPAFTPTGEVGTRFIDPVRMKG